MKWTGRGFLRWTCTTEDLNETHGSLPEFWTDVSTILVYDIIIIIIITKLSDLSPKDSGGNYEFWNIMGSNSTYNPKQ